MFTYNERDLHRMPQPARTHLPIKQFIADSNILDEDSARDTDVCYSLFSGLNQSDIVVFY
jgi:Chs5-Arf1p-binding protein BUD7/BCH1